MVRLTDYPRPQLVRKSYMSLCGLWNYKIQKDDTLPINYDGKINVPYSPEATLSGVNKTVMPDDFLFYNLKIELPNDLVNDKLFIHFGAVDQICDLFINNQYVGSHEGGFLPFAFDIKAFVLSNQIDITLRVKDYSDTQYHARGKQRIKRGGIWYTAQAGIYMPVWLEGVSNDYIENIIITPNIDLNEVVLNIKSSAKEALIDIFDSKLRVNTNVDIHIKVSKMILWSPENPHLYYFKASTNHDEVTSYFAMRKFSLVKDDAGITRLGLNNKPYFMKGLLDQGYYQDGLLTPRDDKDYIDDIMLAKNLGFNTLRKHIKIESLRFYYHCDRLGMIVWQDFVNGGGKYNLFTIGLPVITGLHHHDTHYKMFARTDEIGRQKALQEFVATIKLLYNVPSIALWTIFNEGWGQFDSKMVYQELLKSDNTRIYDHASGWHDQGISDTKSLHVYFKRVKMPKAKAIKGRAIILSECGGYSLKTTNHMFSNKAFGYKKLNSREALEKEYAKFIKRDILPNIPKGLSAFIYTELSDVEDELNGFVTYDREVIKVETETIKKINDLVK